MALDEPKDDDQTYEVSGIKWLVSGKDVPYVLAGDGVRIDHHDAWGGAFDVRPIHKLSGCC